MALISTQIRWPGRKVLAVASTSIWYSTTSPGVTGSAAARVSLWNGFHSVLRSGSSARLEAFSQPRVSSRSGSVGSSSRSPSRTVITCGSGPMSFSDTIQLVSGWSIAAYSVTFAGPAISIGSLSGSLTKRSVDTFRVWVSGICTKESGGTTSSTEPGTHGSGFSRSQLLR
jgi:hypothetical protein